MTSRGTLLITGASGLVGRALAKDASSAWNVYELGRSASGLGNRLVWNPSRGEIEPLPPIDAVVHLAGENIAEGRWSPEKKSRIRESRIQSTELIARALAGLPRKPRVLISASAIGIYGSRGDERLTETSNVGSDFLAEVGSAWERATRSAEDAGIRTVHLRIGVVLDRNGGALKKMLLPFQLGVGGVIGTGSQYLSWISLTDLTRVIQFLIDRDDLSGAFNAVSPEPSTNREFTKALGAVLHRPTIFPVPSFVIRLLFGEMGEATILSSMRVFPERLLKAGFVFAHPTLPEALTHSLSRS